jgi:hypothetical protein
VEEKGERRGEKERRGKTWWRRGWRARLSLGVGMATPVRR